MSALSAQLVRALHLKGNDDPPARTGATPGRCRVTTNRNDSRSKKPALLSLRGALMLTLAVLTGLGIGVLTYLQDQHAAPAVIAGLTAVGASLVLFDRLIGDH